MKIFFLILFLFANSAVAQYRCIDVFKTDTKLFQTLSIAILKMEHSADYELEYAIYSTGIDILPGDGPFATRYYEATKIAANHGVLRPFLENFISRFSELRHLQGEQGWDQINNLNQDNIEQIIQMKRTNENQLATIENLPPQEREVVEKAIIVLAQKLDNSLLRRLVMRTSVPLSSVDFSGPYRKIARSFLQQAIQRGQLSEVFEATQKFLNDRNYYLSPEEKTLFEFF